MRFAIAFVVLIGLGAATRVSGATRQGGVPPQPGGRHFVWRVRHAAAPVYLVGSLHALRNSDYPLPAAIDQAIAGSRLVVFEMNPEAKDTILLDRKLSAAGTYPGGLRLQDKVSLETLQLVRTIAQVRASEYERRRPWAIALFMLARRDLIVFNSRLGVDRYIYNRVRGRARLGGLETSDQFVQALAGLSDTESEAFLLESIDYARRYPRLLEATNIAWRTGDMALMRRIYAGRRRPSGYWRWVEHRTARWLPRIESAIRSGEPTVIVVGALHFVGPEGLIAKLERRGYQLEQL